MGAAAKLREHYGIEIPVSTVRTVTEQHGAAMLVRHQQCREWPNEAGVATLITEMDGSMLPVVETVNPVAAATPSDRRKTRQLSWKEVRLCLAHEPGRETPVYFGATTGSVTEAGEQWRECTIVAGGGKKKKVHRLGGWGRRVPAQNEFEVLGRGHSFFCFFHFCDYPFSHHPAPVREWQNHNTC